MVSFNNPFNDSVPSSFPITGSRFIAPFWANIDIRGTGNIYYRQITDPDPIDFFVYVVQYELIRDFLPGYDYFTLTNLVIITWDAVGYHPQRTDEVKITNISSVYNYSVFYCTVRKYVYC